VKVVPGSSRDEVVGWLGESLKGGTTSAAGCPVPSETHRYGLPMPSSISNRRKPR